MSLRAEAYEKVRDEVLRGNLEFGERTSERVIAEQMVGMSRTPVREALAVLVATGLLDQIPQSGVAVRRIDAEQALRALRLRAGMEPVMVEEIVSQHADISELREALDAMYVANDENNALEFMLADTRMHTALARVGGFSTSVTGLQGLRDQVHLFRLEHRLTPADMQAVLAEHDELLSSIDEQEGKRAKHAIATHLRATRERIETAPAGEPMHVYAQELVH
jgi:DNA-binding GntR family transcriptional regulator